MHTWSATAGRPARSPDWAHLTSASEQRIVADGWAPRDPGDEGNRVFVTCGIGSSVVPLRINAPPQVAPFTLQPED